MSARQVVGMAWYRARDWTRLRAIAADPDAIDESHSQWLEKATKYFRRCEQDGIRIRRVIVDLDELIEFCRAAGIPNDAQARSRFAAQKIEAEEPPS